MNDTKPTYYISVDGKVNTSQSEQLPERYNQALLIKTEFSRKENLERFEKVWASNGHLALRKPWAEFKSKRFWLSLLAWTNFFVNTKAHPLISLGTNPISLNSILFARATVKFVWYCLSKTNKLYPTSSTSELDNLKSRLDIYAWGMSPFVRAPKASSDWHNTVKNHHHHILIKCRDQGNFSVPIIHCALVTASLKKV